MAVQSFVAGGKIDEDIVDGVMEFWNDCTYLDKVPGESNHGANKIIKESTDMAVPSFIKDPRIVKYLDAVQGAITLYVGQYPWASMSELEIIEPFNIQHYKPGQAFTQPHTERCSSDKTTSFRHLVWMTYLNTLYEGEEPQWVPKEIEIKQGKVLSFFCPCDSYIGESSFFLYSFIPIFFNTFLMRK